MDMEFKRSSITPWYAEYFAQTWYRNTFLVRWPSQIGRQVGGERDWNNLYDSGCHFTCLAMAIGIDPARLASELAAQPFFCADASLPAKRISGTRGGLVWDQNKPNEMQREVSLKRVWHSRLGRRVDIMVRFIDAHTTRQLNEARAIVRTAQRQRLHAICGPEDHSHLVAGWTGSDFYLWYPDDEARPVENMLRGEVTLTDLFAENPSAPIEFWLYQIDIK